MFMPLHCPAPFDLTRVLICEITCILACNIKCLQGNLHFVCIRVAVLKGAVCSGGDLHYGSLYIVYIFMSFCFVFS